MGPTTLAKVNRCQCHGERNISKERKWCLTGLLFELCDLNMLEKIFLLKSPFSLCEIVCHKSWPARAHLEASQKYVRMLGENPEMNFHEGKVGVVTMERGGEDMLLSSRSSRIEAILMI
jgi:hypothetical protein